MENPKPTNPYDEWSKDQCLMYWQSLKNALEVARESEMEFRKYIVKREFPNPNEGMNTQELGNGYQLKAAIKYNYNLLDNDTVEKCLNKIENIGNDGKFIADRLVSWKPSFLLTEYRTLQDDAAKGSKSANEILTIISEMLEITEASPTLEIKEPKSKKK